LSRFSELLHHAQDPADALLRAGFQRAGEWRLVNGQADAITFAPAILLPDRSGIYAFAVQGDVMYIGFTATGFDQRFRGYQRPGPSQRTNARVRPLIAEVLAQGISVNVLIATPDPLDWNGLPVTTAAGLEHALIQIIRPAWNLHGR
jgi:hypothetical protein